MSKPVITALVVGILTAAVALQSSPARLLRPTWRFRPSVAPRLTGAAVAAAFIPAMSIIGNCDRPTVLRTIRAITIRPSRTTISGRCEPIRATGSPPIIKGVDRTGARQQASASAPILPAALPCGCPQYGRCHTAR